MVGRFEIILLILTLKLYFLKVQINAEENIKQLTFIKA